MSTSAVPLSFRVAADLTQFRSDMADLSAQLETTKSAMTRMANSFDGSSLIANANAMVIAINNLGGVSALTDTELQNVNTTVSAAIDKYAALGEAAPAALVELQAATEAALEPTISLTGAISETKDAFLDQVATFASGVVIFAGLTEAYHAFTGFLSSSITAYADAQTAEQRLTVAIQTQGYAIPDLKDQYLALGDAYESTTTFSHTAIESAEALFVQLGNVGPGMMNKALQAATDLSAGLGIDLNSAVEMLSRAFEGHTTALSRYGIVLDATQVKEQGMGYVLDAIEAKVGGQAQAQLDTYSGKIAQLGNAWDDVKEKVGAYLVTDPLVQVALQGLVDKTKAAGDGAKSSDTLFSGWYLDLVNLLIPGMKGYTQGLEDAAAQQNAFNGAVAAIPKQPKNLPPTNFFDQLKSASAATTAQMVTDWKKQQDAANAAAASFRASVDSMEESLDDTATAAKVKALSAAVTEMGGVWDLSDTEFANAASQADKLGQSGAKLTGQLQILASMASDRVTVGIGNLGAVFQTTTVPVSNLTKAATAFADAIVGVGASDLPQRVADLDAAVTTLGGDVNLGGKQFLTAADAAKQLAGAGAQLTPQLTILAGMDYTTGLGGLDTFLKNNVVSMKDWIPSIEKSTDDLKLLKGGLDSLASAIGGDVGTAIKDFADLGKSIDTAGDDFSAAFGKNGAFAQGNTLSGIEATVGGITSIAGAAMTAGKAVMALWNDVFGTAGRDAVTQFASTFQGGFAGLQQQLSLLGTQGQQLWIQLTQGTGRNNATQAAANIQAVTTALQAFDSTQNTTFSNLISQIQSFGGSIDPALDPYIQQLEQEGILTSQNAAALQALEGNGVPSYQTLTALQSKYNLTAAQMGPSFQAAQINAQFQTLIDDISTLTAGGGDLQTAMFNVGADGSKSLSGLGTAIQQDIQQAINAGIAIPANLQGAAQALVDNNDLLTATGQAVTNINQLTFGNTMQTDLENLTDTLKQLIQTLTGTGGLTDAIGQVPRNIDIQFNEKVTGGGPTGVVTSAATGGIVTRGKIIPFPTRADYFGFGGFVPQGTDTVPAMLTPGELILNAAQQGMLTAMMGAAAAAGSGNGGPIQVEVYVDGVKQQAVAASRKAAATGRLRPRAASGRSY